MGDRNVKLLVGLSAAALAAAAAAAALHARAEKERPAGFAAPAGKAGSVPAPKKPVLPKRGPGSAAGKSIAPKAAAPAEPEDGFSEILAQLAAMSAEAVPAETPKPAQAEAVPAETLKPAQAEAVPAETLKPAQAEAVPAETPKPAQAEAVPAETPKPADAVDEILGQFAAAPTLSEPASSEPAAQAFTVDEILEGLAAASVSPEPASSEPASSEPASSEPASPEPAAQTEAGEENAFPGKPKAKRILSRVLIAAAFLLIFTVGLCVLLYPSMSNYINTKNQSRVINIYEDSLVPLSETDYGRLIADAQDYNAALSKSGITISEALKDPAKSGNSAGKYEDLLNVAGNGVMGYIAISRLGVTLPIYHGTDETTLQDGVGHICGTSLPVSGSSVHSVLSAHTGLPSAKLFTDIDQLVKGDTFEIHVLNRMYTYRVDQILTVLPSEVDALGIIDGRNYVTLVTCTPYGVNSHRLLVRGVFVREDVSRESTQGQQTSANAGRTETGQPAQTGSAAIVWASGVFETAVTGLVRAVEWAMDIFGVAH